MGSRRGDKTEAVGATEVFLGLGSNIGDRRGNIERGMAGLGDGGVSLRRRSSLYETEPVGITEQPWFLNAVVIGETDLPPAALLRLCKGIERHVGRRRSERFGPRTLDIDILLYGQDVLESPELTIPHPRLHERRFALAPLVEIDQGARDPRDGRPFAEILRGLDEGKKVTRLGANES